MIESSCSSVQEILDLHSERAEDSAQVSPWTGIFAAVASEAVKKLSRIERAVP